ncbi:MAG: cysteine--tRNA ligase [Conexivisphaerales archaeon]
MTFKLVNAYISCAIKLLKLYNYMTDSEEKFEPLYKNEVRIFVCGPTVQDYMHIGHARTYVFFDVLRRYLLSSGYNVKLLINVTDIDESIEREAGGLVENFIEEKVDSYKMDMENLKVFQLFGFERVSRYIQIMISQISELINKGYAYPTEEAVFFDTSKVNNFGKLAHLTKKELELMPLELSQKKKNLLDFALWRNLQSKSNVYNSPWGKGWPGWHIQDTAVAISMLGPQYDIHGGAYDLIYPHHVSEIAQAEALSGKKPYVKYWVYTGFVTIEGKKMSKSDGNCVYVKDVLNKYDADSIRFYLLSERYNKNIDYDPESLERRSNELKAIKDKLAGVNLSYNAKSKRFYNQICEALNDNFNTPKLIKLIEEAINYPGKLDITLSEAKQALVNTSSILGVEFVS